ncbi:DsbA family oxidoreductase [Gryllotalpicola protaetiae]|uniref:DsbA family oxidoreductase n=1 Tax=Gryllotalpicola protaetiae TaxID=2419771 RepID=A0A387BVY7_9MICO|nr:DsbA family oxidoreductase [Gryllotalpicola protaetiae]AYG05069.1 DsbA family oxidoreductase [Gryllotalpicola protaetiae]
MSSETPPIKVDVWSDVACPWCYIGKRKFEAGSGLFAGGGEGRGVEIEYHSFELSPDTPVDFQGGEAEFLATHKGIPEAQAQQLLDRVTGIAASVGLDYDYDRLQHTNTVLAHEAIHFAKSQGRQLDFMERLFKAYFIDGRHVGKVDDLADLGAEIGLDRAELKSALEEHTHLADVREDQQAAVEYGIQGVPFFVIDGKYGVSGAQEAQTFAQVLEQVWGERSAAPEEVSA